MKYERLSDLGWWLRLDDWRRSGFSLHAYCQIKGWSYVTALGWRRKLVRRLLGPLPRFSGER